MSFLALVNTQDVYESIIIVANNDKSKLYHKHDNEFKQAKYITRDWSMTIKHKAIRYKINYI